MANYQLDRSKDYLHFETNVQPSSLILIISNFIPESNQFRTFLCTSS